MHIRIQKKPDEGGSTLSRVSVGLAHGLTVTSRKDEFCYCIYRGDRHHAIRALEQCITALKALPGEPDIIPDEEFIWMNANNKNF